MSERFISTYSIYIASTIVIRMDVMFFKGKGKAIPSQAWTGPEGSIRLRLPDFKTIGTRRW